MGMSSWIQNPGKNKMNVLLQKRTIFFSFLAALIVILHFVFLMSCFEPAISTPDANGYFGQAKLIAHEHRTYFETESVLQYVGHHWLKADDTRYFSRYPPGFPTILAVVYRIFGPEATLLINPLMASLSLFALFLVCRLWIGEGWGLLAAALMAFNPTANQHALAGDSHTSTLFFLIWALFFVARWEKTHSLWWAFGTGIFLGIIPAIRYPEALFVFAFGIFMLLNTKGDRAAWRSLIAGVIGFALPFGALCVRNHFAFGAFWETGYGFVDEQRVFGWEYLISHALQYLLRLQGEGCGLLFGLGIVGIAALCARHDTWKRGILLASLVVPVTVLYMSYFWPADNASMRFLLPTFFMYTIAGVWLLQMIGEHRHRAALAGSAVLLFVTILWGFPLSIQSMKLLEYPNAALAEITRVLKNRVAPGSIVIAIDPINQHLDFLGYWRLADDSILMRHDLKSFQPFMKDKNMANVMQRNRIDDVQKRYGNLGGHELFVAFSQDIWKWSGEHRKVYWICRERQYNLYRDQLSQRHKMKIVEEIELPGRKVSRSGMPDRFGAPFGQAGRSMRGPGARQQRPFLQGKDSFGTGSAMVRRFEALANDEPLLLVEWTREIP